MSRESQQRDVETLIVDRPQLSYHIYFFLLSSHHVQLHLSKLSHEPVNYQDATIYGEECVTAFRKDHVLYSITVLKKKGADSTFEWYKYSSALRGKVV